MCARQTDGKPFYLPRNDKGHYMLDIAQFLTKGQSCPNGHPEINVLMDHEEHDQNWIEQMSRMTSTPSFFLQPLMFEREECEMEFCPALKSSEHQLFFELWNRRKHHNGRLGLMGSVLSETFATTSSTRSFVSHGVQEDSDSGHRLCEKGGEGSKRPEIQGNTMAVSGTSCSKEPAREQVGALDTLRSLRFTVGVHPNGWSPGWRHQESESSNGAKSSGRDASFTTCRDDAVGGALQGGLGQGDGGRKDEDHVEGQEYQLQWEKATKMVSKAQSKMKESSGQRSSGAEGYGATTSPTRSTASWEQVQASPERKIENPMDYLTDVEKEQIRRTVEARMLAQGVATSLSDNEVELEPDYRSSSMQ